MGEIRQVQGCSGYWGGAVVFNEMTRVAPKRGSKEVREAQTRFIMYPKECPQIRAPS